MKVADFNYELPPELIAQHPASKRSDSRLLHVTKSGQFYDKMITDIVDVLQPGDLMVLNNTKVIPARVYGRKESGGKVEILLERIINERQFLAQIRSSRSPKIGQKLSVEGSEELMLTMTGRHDQFFELTINTNVDLFAWFDKVGHMPLPPYIQRQDVLEDQQRYQTVFAEQQGAVAAPTAGLHYDEALLQDIQDRGVQIETITLHVGAGTYQPVRVDSIEDHQMHSEWIDVNEQVCTAIQDTKQRGGRVIAIGTTVVRSLETAANSALDQENSKGAVIVPYQGETDIFIYPGYDFKVVDLLQTNFHLPESTLMMLASAFAGYENIMNAYQHAIEQRYRFFSYGDAMLLERN